MYNFTELLRLSLLSVLIFQVLVIAFQISLNKRKEAFYYLLYIIFVFLYNIRLIISENAALQLEDLIIYLDKPVVAFIFWSYFKFARHFLDIPNLNTTFNKIAKTFEYTLIFGAVILSGIIYFFGKSALLDWTFSAFSLYAAVSSVVQLIYFVKIRRTTLNGFVVSGAFLILLGSTITFVLYEWQKINPVFNAANLTIPHLLATFLELVIFNTGISMKSYILEKEKRFTDQELIAKMKENEVISKELNQVKSSISADLHDDIGATYNSIDIYATVTEKALHTGDVLLALEYQNKIRSLASESLSDIRDTIWLLRQNGNISISFLIDKWTDRARSVLEAKGIELICKNDPFTERLISLNERRHLYFSLKEVLNNVLKHSGTAKLEISNHHDKGKDWIVIRDFGTGFDKKMKSDGEGLQNISMRIQQIGGILEITSSPGKGTTISIGI